MLSEALAGLGLALAAAAVYFVLYKPLAFRRRMAAQGVRGTGFVPLLGILPDRNAAHRDDDPFRPMRERIAKYGRSCVTEIGWKPRLFTADPEVAQDVLVRQATAFSKPSAVKLFLGPFLGNGLVTATGETHKRQRRTITPAFHFTNLRAMVRLMDVGGFLERHVPAEDGAEVDVVHLMSEATLHIIAKAAFGADFEADPTSADVIREVFTTSVAVHTWRIFHLVGLVPGLRSLPTPGKLLVERNMARLTAEAERLVESRRAGRSRNLLENESGKDLLDLLLEARDSDGSGAGMSQRQLLDEMNTFVLAGHETTATLLSWALKELMEHPEHWARLAAEVDARLGRDRAFEYEDMREMPFLAAVVQETLRLHPPVSVVVREATRPVELRRSAGEGGGTVRLEAGDSVTVSVNQIHHDADLWERPEEFVPGRWLGDPAPRRRHPAAFLPFVMGPRSCIGSKFAELEARAVLCRLVQRYRFELVPGQRIVPSPKITRGFKYGLRATVRHRRARPE